MSGKKNLTGRRATLRPDSKPGVKGLSFNRLFSRPDRDPIETADWSLRNAVIRNAKGEVIFEQKDVEAPCDWSDMAVTVVASRYFRGKLGQEGRERSVKALLLRVVDTIATWGMDQCYFGTSEDANVFRDELMVMLLRQMASFNSPVWFNVGVESQPQCSACFILSVQDTMESILQWYYQEGLIFKGGSGSGVNLSTLRSSREPLAGGGTASGPVSFMRAADASAGVIKSGGKTRRAAKMVILDVDHPDIVEFIRCKALEEKKAQALIRAGYDPSFEGEAYNTVAFQNSNHSVRVSDAFMKAVEANKNWDTRYILSGQVATTFSARDLFREIAQAAYQCGDPGLQFETAINSLHTCPNTAPIRASNPCAEYFHVDDSACNLASLRLTAFLDEQEGTFNIPAFQHAISVMITAQDILIDKAGYPSEAIRHNSMTMRAIGLGYADLGALLMSLGLPYDSDEGRAWASTITALMTGEAYLQSARIARTRGAFAEFERNREPMLNVIAYHKAKVSEIKSQYVPSYMLSEASRTWEKALEEGRAWGYSNCQVTVLAPTGTVAFMMDCDTTGIEPDVALVKHKALSGGGNLRIINKTVGKALRRLGYDDDAVSHILGELEQHGSAELISAIKPEHLPVFDCALCSQNGTRVISPLGHLKMLAAVQPFISGGISKTINLPSDTTVDQIEDLFMEAWKMNLKAVSVYRDGCKTVQPLTLKEPNSQFAGPIRRRLPVDCKSVRHKFEIAGQKGYIHTGFYEDGKVGEIFIRMAKEGSTISGLMDTIATLTSIALQYGVPLEALVNKFSHVRFEPSGMTSNPQIPFAKSLTDYIFRYLGTRFLTREQQEVAGLLTSDRGLPGLAQEHLGPAIGTSTKHAGHTFHPQSDAPACPDCGAIMVRNGSCYKCLNCGATSGCS